MAIKITSKKLLLLLFPANGMVGERVVSQADLRIFFQDMKPGSLRALISLLVNKKLVRREHSESGNLYSLTSLGLSLLFSHFPALKPSNGYLEWTVVMFANPPAYDKQFRYLRSRLVQANFLPLTRGIYISAVSLPTDLEHLFLSNYLNSVLVGQVSNWVFGDVWSTIEATNALSDTQKIYSGISKELSELLSAKQHSSSLSSQQKQHISSVFDRLLEILSTDSGIALPGSGKGTKPADLISSIQALIFD